MMKKQFRGLILLLSLLICFIFPAFCFASYDEYVDPRWKWYTTTDSKKCYVDTQSIEYDATTQVAKVWTLFQHQENPSSKFLYEISFKTKKMNILRTVMAYPGGKMVSQDTNSKLGWHIEPDSEEEALANNVASILHINSPYAGGPNRWKWVHSTDTYGLYIAKDTIVYLPDIECFGIWAKRLDLNGHSTTHFYTMNFDAKLIYDETAMPDTFVPDSDEEYIFNATKELIGKA